MTQKVGWQLVAREYQLGPLINYSKDIYLSESEAIRHRVRWREDLIKQYADVDVYVLEVTVHVPRT